MINGTSHVTSPQLRVIEEFVRRSDNNLMWGRNTLGLGRDAQNIINKGVDTVPLTARITLAGKIMAAVGNFTCVDNSVLKAVTEIIMILLPEWKTIILPPNLPATTQEETVALAAPPAPVASQAPTKEQVVVPTKTPRRKRRKITKPAETTEIKPVSHVAVSWLTYVSQKLFDGAQELFNKQPDDKKKKALRTGLHRAALQMKQVYQGQIKEEELPSPSDKLWRLVHDYFPEWTNASQAGFGDWMLKNGFIKPEDL